MTFLFFGVMSLLLASLVPPLVAPRKLSCQDFDSQTEAQETFVDRPADFSSFSSDPDGHICIDLPRTPEPMPSIEGINFEIMNLSCGPWYPVLVDWINTQIEQVPNELAAQSLSAYLIGRNEDLSCFAGRPIPGGGVNTGDGTATAGN